MRLSYGPRDVLVRFDDPNLVSYAGLLPVMRLAEQVDLAGLVDARVRPDLPTRARPVARRQRSWPGWSPARTASTISTCCVTAAWVRCSLRCMRRRRWVVPAFFSWGHGLQLEAASRDLLTALARRVPLLPGADRLTFVDVESLLRRVYGHGKQVPRTGMPRSAVTGPNCVACRR